MPGPPTGTVTFLFTDIEGSTKLWEQYPEAMRPALARHDAILRAAVETHHGYTVKMLGDGIHAAFACASDALAAALAAQRALSAELWGEMGPLRVRIALHLGAVEGRDGDYFGPPVNRAARLLSTGHGGQVLLSLATQESVRDGLPPGVGLRDLGTHRLKDLAQPEHIFQLVAPDLPADFPPLTTLDARLNNLPVQPTPLIGREKQVAAVQKMLRRDDVRLVTLTGPGGTGKTRLGLQVAADLLDQFENGAYFINLASISDASLVASAIAQALDVREAGRRPPLENVKGFLRDKQLLLLLDNFEQVVSSAPLVSELLATCTRLKILVTSRERLHLRGEHEFSVPPLALPDLKRLPETRPDLVPALLSQVASVTLFIQRAQAVKADFRITNENAAVVAEICARLDGLPLAIELAAARCKLLSPQAIQLRLTNRLAFLSSRARDLPERQRTLRGTMDWSCALLSEDQSKLFQRLSVFVGGCTLEAAESVCRAELPIEIFTDLESLVDKSLLHAQETRNGEPRFFMLETIRGYALERLNESGEAPGIQRQHATFFLHLAEQAEPKLTGAEQALWLERLGQDHDNLRAALAWFFEQGETESAARLAGAVWRYWFVRGYLSQARQWLERCIQQDGALPVALRAKLLNAAGVITRMQGEHAQAQVYLEDSLALCRELGDLSGVAGTLNSLGILAQVQGDYALAQRSFEESVALRQQLGDRAGAAVALGNLGVTFQNQGNHTRAAELYEESLSIKRALGDQAGMAMTLINLGAIALGQDDLAKAHPYLNESLQLGRELGDQQNIGICLNNLGMIALFQGDLERARACQEECLTIFQKLGSKEGIAWGLEGMAAVWSALGEAVKGGRLFGASQALRELAGIPLMPGDRATYDRNVSAVRAQLDETTFAAEWANGQAMTMEQAVAYALEGRNPCQQAV